MPKCVRRNVKKCSFYFGEVFSLPVAIKKGTWNYLCSFFSLKQTIMDPNFEKIYDVYAPVLYSIALQLCPTEAKAEEVLLATFNKIYTQKLILLNERPSYITLIKLTIATAHELLHTGKTTFNFKIKEFENMPLLHQLLVEQLSVENYCSKNNIARQEVQLLIKKEFKLIQQLSKKTSFAMDSNTLGTPHLKI